MKQNKYKKSYYDKSKNCYIDTTRNIEYYPKSYCELCGSTSYLTCHHFIPQHTYKNAIETVKTRVPKTLTQEFVNENQKIWTLCLNCHSDVHSMSNERFYNKYGVERSNYIWQDK